MVKYLNDLPFYIKGILWALLMVSIGIIFSWPAFVAVGQLTLMVSAAFFGAAFVTTIFRK